MRLFSRNPSIYPVSVAIVAGLTVAVVYGIITVWWIVGRNGEPSGGWGLDFTSAALQVVGWSFLIFLVAQAGGGAPSESETASARRTRP